MRKMIELLAWILAASVIAGCGIQAPARPTVQEGRAFHALALGPADGDDALTGSTNPVAATDVSVAVFLAGLPRKSRLVVGIVDRSTMRYAVRKFDPAPESVILRVVTFNAVPAPGGEPLQAFAAALGSSGTVISYDSTPLSIERSTVDEGAFVSTQLVLDDDAAGRN